SSLVGLGPADDVMHEQVGFRSWHRLAVWKRHFAIEEQSINQEIEQLGVVRVVGCAVLLRMTVHDRFDDAGAFDPRAVDREARPAAMEPEPWRLPEDEPLVFHLLGDEAALDAREL